MKNFTSTLILLFVIQFLSGSSLFGQEEPLFRNADLLIKQWNSSTDPAVQNKGEELDNLINNPESMLVFFNGEFNTRGTATPNSLIISPEGLDALYSPNELFENIQLIRIMASNLNFSIDIEKMNHIPDLKYIFVLATYEICPENPGNNSCYSEKINNEISISYSENNPLLIYKVSPLR